MNQTHGNRKLKVIVFNGAVLLVGFAIAVTCKADPAMFAAFMTGLGIQSGAFVYGNAKEHQAKAEAAKLQ